MSIPCLRRKIACSSFTSCSVWCAPADFYVKCPTNVRLARSFVRSYCFSLSFFWSIIIIGGQEENMCDWHQTEFPIWHEQMFSLPNEFNLRNETFVRRRRKFLLCWQNMINVWLITFPNKSRSMTDYSNRKTRRIYCWRERRGGGRMLPLSWRAPNKFSYNSFFFFVLFASQTNEKWLCTTYCYIFIFFIFPFDLL